MSTKFNTDSIRNVAITGHSDTGKTSLVVELAAARVRAGLDPAQLLVLAPSRGAAGELRDRVAARLGEFSWQAIYAGFAVAGFILIIWGYVLARQAPVVSRDR